jgi:hypothetical protein
MWHVDRGFSEAGIYLLGKGLLNVMGSRQAKSLGRGMSSNLCSEYSSRHWVDRLGSLRN